MDKQEELELVQSLQDAVEQMKIADMEESPEEAFETFQCACCGEEKMYAGAVTYKDYLLCNDCVLIAEISFALHKIEDIEELIDSMEEKRLENICTMLKKESEYMNN